jgi:hypothetical protein
MCACDLVGDLGAALLVGDRATRVALIAEYYGLAAGLAVEELEDPARWLLVEESRYDGSVWLTDASSPEEAIAVHDQQECVEDWNVVGVVDLDTGEVVLPSATRTFLGDDPVEAAATARRALRRLQAVLSKEVWQIYGSAADLLDAIAVELARAGYDPAKYVPATDEPRWEGEEWVEGDAAAGS